MRESGEMPVSCRDGCGGGGGGDATCRRNAQVSILISGIRLGWRAGHRGRYAGLCSPSCRRFARSNFVRLRRVIQVGRRWQVAFRQSQQPARLLEYRGGWSREVGAGRYRGFRGEGG